MTKHAAATEPGETAIREKIACILGAEDIDNIGSTILMNGTSQEEMILCLEGGDYWGNAVEELLDPNVLSQYDHLDKNDWIVFKVPLAVCLEISTVSNQYGLEEDLRVVLPVGYIRTFFLFESGEIALADVLIDPSRASEIYLN